jgi:pilus assembly protein CpaE
MSADEGKIQVLIVDDIPETRENLRKLLYFENDIEVVAAASSGEEGVEFAKEYQPDIVLMDINMPGVDGISASEAIAREAPTAQVIMMSVQSEADYLRRSMLAGARDFLTKPFSGDELVSTIRRVYEMGESRRRAMPMMRPTPGGPTAIATAPQRPEGKVVALFSPKGGVGCTLLAVNLAIALHQASKGSVVLVDASLQFGDMTVMLDLRPTHSIIDLVQQIDEIDRGMLETVLIPHSTGIKVLLAPPRPEMADLVSPENLQRILGQLKRQYDYVVVDTWTSLHDTVLVILDIADRIILPTTPDISSLRNVRLFFEVTEQLDYPPEKLALVLNKSDRRSRIRASDIQESMKHPVTEEIPLDDAAALASVNQGVPFVVSDGSRPISQAVTRLAEKLLDNWAAVAEAEAAAATAAESPVEDAARRRLGRFFR